MNDFKRNFDFDGIILRDFTNLTENESEIVRTWRNHSSIKKWMYSNHIISKKEHANFIANLNADNKNYFWLVKNKESEPIGIIYLNKVDFINRNAYLGIYSNPNSYTIGAGSLLIECLKRVAFKVMKLHTLKLEVIDTNKKALEFYKKSGFMEEGRLKEYVLRNGKWHNVVIMGLIRKEVGDNGD
jgi:UDP-4-amino-4,6-dideoxy-N-acetyl-beta-L-altrosamine N-acetyltransferase